MCNVFLLLKVFSLDAQEKGVRILNCAYGIVPNRKNWEKHMERETMFFLLFKGKHIYKEKKNKGGLEGN